MTDDEWLHIRPEDSYSEGEFKIKPEPADYNIIIEYPAKVATKQDLRDFLKKGLL